ncbi:MAG: ABC transporter substrate-binding protein, partial [Thermoleophilaceae bacterium]|nr:ABC transporter substrate-binding protein [Thermoleophilaceae bacterium]
MAVLCLFGVLALGIAACGKEDEEGGGSGGGKAEGTELTIYSSLPLQGTSKEQSEAVIDGEMLALKQAGDKVGKYTIKYESLDDSTAQNPGTADEAQTADNARKAVQDPTTIFYLGEFNSGGTKVSLPILNKAGIPQISPSNTAVGLTTDEPGADPGEPDKYYPTGERTYARIVPKDTIQGAALATIMQEDGCKSVHIFNDKTTYGAGLGRNVENSAKELGLEVTGNDGTDRNAPNYRSL